MLEEGRLHLSGIAKIMPHLTEANRDTLLARAAHKSKREIEELVVELAPKPDVPPGVRKLPERLKKAEPTVELGPDRVTDLHTPTEAKPALVEPLAPARYKVQFTASAELRAKLERLQALLPDGDLAAIIEEAVTEKLERLEAKRFGKTKSPRKTIEETDTSPSSRYIPAAVKRAVSQRDGNQCTFVDAQGRRCKERQTLQFHHREPYARGGDHSPENIQMMCPLCRYRHKGHYAEYRIMPRRVA